MEDSSLVPQINRMRQRFFDEGIVDQPFFSLQLFSTHDYPNYAEDRLHMYFEETNERLATIEELLAKNPVDLIEMDMPLLMFASTSASIGAKKVKIEAYAALDCCRCESVDGVKAAIEKAKMELANFKTRLDPYRELLKQKNPKRGGGN